jgi:hypothetical protein
MNTTHFEPESIAQQLGTGGVDNLVTNAELVCTNEQRRIQLSNEGSILSLQAEYQALLTEERRLETLLLSAPPSGDMRRLRRRAVYCWLLTAILTLSGLAFMMLTLAPFRMGWMSWLFAIGIAGLTPFLVEKLLEKSVVLVKVLNALATIAAVAGLMLLAEVRGNLLEQQLRQDQDQAVVIDDAAPASDSGNSFYEKSERLLELAMLFLAFSMEVGAGLALLEAWRSSPGNSEDWKALRRELAEFRSRKSAIVRTVVDLRNEPGIFVARFWRDFYRAMLSNGVRSAMTKFLVLAFVIFIGSAARVNAQDRLDLVIAVDLTQSVGVVGPDGKTEFQKNIEAVSRLLAQVPAGARVTIIGITDHSFAQPYILMSARTSADPGYFGEHLKNGRRQLVRAWDTRSSRLNSKFPRTDILGALRLAGQIFAQEPRNATRNLIIFSDMRQNTKELNLESSQVVEPRSAAAADRGPVAELRNIQVFICGADGADRSPVYWQTLRMFWVNYFRNVKVDLRGYSVLRELPNDSK